MAENDPEVREVAELGRLERRRMGPVRAHHILIAAAVIVAIGIAVLMLFKQR